MIAEIILVPSPDLQPAPFFTPAKACELGIDWISRNGAGICAEKTGHFDHRETSRGHTVKTSHFDCRRWGCFTMNCSKSLRSRPSQIQTLRGSFAFYGSFFGRIAGAFECFATSVRFEGVLATRFIIRIAFGIVRFTFGNFVVFHIIGTRATSPLTRKNNSQMNVIDTLTQRNEAFANSRFSAELKIMPSLKTMIIGCVDPRVDPFDIFGLAPGEAAVIRNVGGRITPGNTPDDGDAAHRRQSQRW